MRVRGLLLSLLVFGLVFVSCLSEADVGEDDEFGDVDASDEPSEDIVEPAAEEKVEVPKPEYKLPEVTGNAFFTEAFAHPQIPKRWVLSEAKKEETDEVIAKYDGKWSVEEAQDNPMDGDLGLVLKSKARHHAIAAPLDRPYDFSGNPLVVQYEVKYQSGMDCGGSYIKLLRQDPGLDLKNFVDKTPFTIMFGPDKCGVDSKLHFIFQHKNPKTGKYEEKHAKPPTKKFNEVFDDKRSHLFTLVVNPDNKFEIYVDQNLVNSGSLLADFSPAVNPAAEIEDPNDKKPADWDEKEKIADPDAKKPEDWDETIPEMTPDESAVKPEGWLDDEPELIPDPSAEKPSDWDDDMDGEWEAAKISNPKCEGAPGCGEWTRPQIKNPLYKGKWRAPMIANPNYKGIWKPKIIPNPDFFEDKTPYKMTPFVAVGLELWSMSDNILFDNFIITDDKAVADNWAGKTWLLKNRYETAKAASSGKSGISGFFGMLLDAANDRPWLYAVYLVVVLLPVVVISIFLCPSKPQIPEDEDDAAQRKKTDEPTADDTIDEEAEPEQENGDTAAGGGDAPEVEETKKTGKSALDAEEEEEEEENEGENDEETEEVTRRSSPRKRKPRKE